MKSSKTIAGISLIVVLLISIPSMFIPQQFKNEFPMGFQEDKLTYKHGNPIKIESAVIRENPNIFLVKFKTHTELQKFVKSNHFKILTKYKLIPLALVEGNYKEVVDFARKHNIGVVGIYYNHIFYLPKYTINQNTSIRTTSLESAKSIKADYLWNKGMRGQTIIISIIDSGVDGSHPDLSGKIVAEKSFVLKIYGYDQDKPDPFDPDANPHGTMVAGVAAGKGELDEEMGTGVAPEALLLNARVFPKEGGATLAGIIAAIEWSVEQGAHVINMSLGGGALYSDPLKEAVEAASQEGVVVVIAAGNAGDSGRFSMSVGSPGNAPSAITVGATNVEGNLLKEYSSIGPTLDLIVKPEVVAPTGVPAPIPGGGYVEAVDGTSFSAPHVAGAAALLVQYLKSKAIPESKIPGIVKMALIAGARPVNTSAGLMYLDLAIGGGFIDLKESYLILENTKSGTEFENFEVLPKRIPTGIHEGEIFFPFTEKIFIGQTIVFNITIASGYTTTINVELVGDISAVLQLNSPTSVEIVPGTYLYELNITAKETASPGEYSGYVVFSDGTVEVRIPIEFKLTQPKFKALWDLHFTDWTVDFPYGQYRYFYKSLEERDVSITIWFHSFKPFDEEDLEGYDFVFLPDTASITPILDEKGYYLGNTTIELDPSIDALRTYIENGGSVILIAMDPLSNDMDAVNRFTSYYGIEFKEKMLVPRGTQAIPKAETITGHILTYNVPAIPFYGVGLKIDEGLAVPLAYYSINPVMALYMNEKGGSLLAISTNFLFDNWAFLGEYAGISGDVLEQLVDNYLYMLSLKYLSSVTLSKVSVVVGEAIDVTIELESGAPSNFTGIIRNYFGVIHYDLAGTGNTRTATVTIMASGNNLIGVRFYTDRGWIDAGKRLEATKSENNPPTLTAPTTVYVKEGNPAIIELTISDDSPLMASTKIAIIYGNISFSVKAELVSENEVKLKLSIPWSLVNASLRLTGKDYFAVGLKINYTDLNFNYQYEEIVITIKLGSPPLQISPTLIIGVVGLVIIIGALWFIFRRRKI